MDFNSFKNYITNRAVDAKNTITDFQRKLDPSALLAYFSTDQLLKWTEDISKSAATMYDKAMDGEYLKTSIGGGNHRLFDGGHDLDGAWEAIKNASPDDTFMQEVLVYFEALWKDITTAKGLPFDTWTTENYDSFANWVTNTIPGANKEWVYDLLSFDALELFGTSLGGVAAIFALNDKDTKRLSELLGSMGVLSIISANPIMGIVMVIVAGYAYFVKKKEFDATSLLKGGILSGATFAIVTVLGLPLLIELVLVILFTILFRKYWDKSVELFPVVQAYYDTNVKPSLEKGISGLKGAF